MKSVLLNLDEETAEEVNAYAKRKKRTRTAIYRQLIDTGLKFRVHKKEKRND